VEVIARYCMIVSPWRHKPGDAYCLALTPVDTDYTQFTHTG